MDEDLIDHGRSFLDAGITGQGHGNVASQPIHAGVDAGADGASFDLELTNSRMKDPITGIALTSYFSTRNVSIKYVVRNTVVEGVRVPFFPGVTVQNGAFTPLGVPSVGTRLDVEFVNNRVVQRSTSTDDGFSFFNFAGTISDLRLKAEGNSLSGMGSTGRGLRFQGAGTTLLSNIDAGGGALGSRGLNSIVGFGVDIEALNYSVTLTNNWWGSIAGPASVVELGTASIAVVPFLLGAPRP